MIYYKLPLKHSILLFLKEFTHPHCRNPWKIVCAPHLRTMLVLIQYGVATHLILLIINLPSPFSPIFLVLLNFFPEFFGCFFRIFFSGSSPFVFKIFQGFYLGFFSSVYFLSFSPFLDFLFFRFIFWYSLFFFFFFFQVLSIFRFSSFWNFSLERT